MGYAHRTPAWAQPLAATSERTTYWGVVPGRPAVRRQGLPSHPRDVPLPATFEEWYETAAANLGRAEQADLSLSRVLAGGGLVLGQLVGLLPVATLLAAELGFRTVRPEPGTLLAGAALLVVVWVSWAWYRRRWTRAWELRKAWSLAIHDPAVLALPVRPTAPGRERDIDTDPEATHPYRARELFPIEERPFVDRLFTGLGGHTDRVRGREALRTWPLLVAAVLVLASPYILTTWPAWPIAAGQALLPATAVVSVLPPVVSAGGRHVRRLRFTHRVAQLETRDRQRWIGWRMLEGIAGPDAGPQPEGQQLEARRIGVTLREEGDTEVRGTATLEVLPAQPPVTGDTTVPPGPWTFEMSDHGRARLVPSEPSRPPLDVTVTALISGFHQGNMGGRVRSHWLVLSDGTHLPVECGDQTSLVTVAELAGVRVVRPRMVA